MNFKTLLLLAVAGLTFASCGDDDDEPATPTELLTAGTWTSSGSIGDDGVFVALTADDCDIDDTVLFRTDNTTVFDYNDDTSCGGVADEPTETGTWAIANNKLTVGLDGIALTADFTVTSNRLEIKFDAFDETEVYTR